MSQRDEKKSFFIYGKTTRRSLFLMEMFVAVAALTALWVGGSRVAVAILAQGLIFYAWWFARRGYEAKGGHAQIVKYFDDLKR